MKCVRHFEALQGHKHWTLPSTLMQERLSDKSILKSGNAAMLTATFREMFQTIHLDQIEECPQQQMPLGVTTYLKSPALLLIIQRERARQR